MSIAALFAIAAAAAAAVMASLLSVDGWAEATLWLTALTIGTIGLVLAYGVGITWARRRKRLWG